MRTIDLISLGTFLIIAYLVMDQEGLKGWGEKFQEEAKAPPAEQALPPEYAPKNPESFASEEKLLEDLKFRRQKLEFAFIEERKEQKVEGQFRQKQESLRRELDELHSKILEDYRRLRREEGLRNQGLR